MPALDEQGNAKARSFGVRVYTGPYSVAYIGTCVLSDVSIDDIMKNTEVRILLVMKERLYFRISPDLRHKLNARVEQSDTTLTLLMERYITQGLAKDAGEVMTAWQHSL